MHMMFHILGRELPAYGVMIAAGTVLASALALLKVKRAGLSADDALLLEACGLLGGFVGAKVLYLAVSFREIEWLRMTDPSYLNTQMQSGFVFFGGLTGGLMCVCMAGRLFHIAVLPYLNEVIFCVPIAHAFGRIGCFLAGCCYGVPWHGMISVHYPAGGIAPAGIALFPVQIAEAAGLIIISLTGMYLQHTKRLSRPVRAYLLSYSILRFMTEYARFDAARGRALVFSTSQWISMAMLLAILLYHYKNRECRSF